MQSIIDFPSIIDEYQEEDKQYHVNEYRNLEWVVKPHQKERRNVKEKKLKDEELKAVS